MRTWLLAATFLLLPSVLFSTTLTVEQAGGGDFASIAAAIDASAAGDTILVGPGYYHEPRRVVTHTLVLMSTGGASVTTIDGDYDHQIWQFEYATGVVVDGFRFVRSYNTVNRSVVALIYASEGVVRNCTFEDNDNNAITSWTDASVTIENCTFLGSGVDFRGAVYVSTRASATITNCDFIGNHASVEGGAVTAVSESNISISGCEFRDNSASEKGGAIHAGIGVVADITDCLFVSNTSYSGSAILAHKATLSVRNCTFEDNVADAYDGGCVQVQFGSYVFERNIVSNDTGYAALFPDLTSGPHACNIFFNTSGMNILGEPLGPTDLEVWPGYCDIDAGDYTVGGDGPAAAAGSACGQLIGAFDVGCPVSPPPPDMPPPPPDPNLPVITGIVDVPNDQGREVRIYWDASQQDDASAYPQVLSYGIYRYDGMIMKASDVLARGPRDIAGALIPGWDYLMSVPARGDIEYQTIVKTTCDSTETAGLCQSAYFVSAQTEYPTLFWDSEPDTGYSVDNLPPEVLGGLIVTVSADGFNRLEWPESGAADIDAYNVYRGPNAGFEVRDDARVAVVEQLNWRDPTRGVFVYKVTAMDKAGNESEPVAASAAPVRFSIGQNVPNPFNPSTIIPYAVPTGGGYVNLTIYDVAGRRVRTLLDGNETPGAKSVEWNGRDDRGQRVSSGVYFYRFTAPGFEDTRKMVLVQ